MGDRSLKVQGLNFMIFLVWISLYFGKAISGEFGRVASKGAVVIDNSSKWRMEPDIPLIVQVNGLDIAAMKNETL